MAELLKVREITIDTMQHKDFATKEEELKVMRFYQNDLNSAKLLINVTHDKVVTDFSTATKVQIAFLKPDGKRVFQDVQNVNQMQGKYYVVLSTQTLIAYGNVVAQLRLTFPDNKVIETCKFVFAVDESIMSDEAMKSTNEFPVIQKAIEAGEKLEGVDINGIIAAGAKADAALPKAGGTMTGDLVMATDKNIVLSSDDYLLKIRGQKGNSKVVAQVFRPDGTSEFIGEYRGDLNRLTINCDTNLVKKTGDPITGELTMRGSGARLVIDEGGQSVTIDQPTSQTSARGFLYRENGATLGGIGRIRSTTDAYNYIGWGANPWDSASALIVSDKVFKYKNKDVAMRDKDDRATIPVTADAELITSYGVIADRRGNTVTLRAPIRRKVGSTNGHVFTLPPGMRPTMMLTQVVHASDGTPALMTIPSDTGQVLLQTITPAIMGKDYHIVLTYVAD